MAEVAPEIVEYVRQALGKKYAAIVIRTALKKAGHSDATISAAFAAVKQDRPARTPKAEAAFESEPELLPLPPIETVPNPPPVQELLPPEQRRRMHIRHMLALCLFLLALILLMYAALAPLLIR